MEGKVAYFGSATRKLETGVVEVYGRNYFLGNMWFGVPMDNFR